MLPSIEKLLEYTNPKVLARYDKDFPHNKWKAEEALTELLKFLWLGQKQKEAQQLHPHDETFQFFSAIHVEMSEIDDMWHTFILFTKDYMDFGNHYFGYYIHHSPTGDEEKLQPDAFQIDLERFLSFTYDHLGEQTVRKWFEELLTDDVC